MNHTPPLNGPVQIPRLPCLPDVNPVFSPSRCPRRHAVSSRMGPAEKTREGFSKPSDNGLFWLILYATMYLGMYVDM